MASSILDPRPTILFVTGRLAEASLRSIVAPIAEQLGFGFEIAVPGVQVAALLHVDLLLKRLDVPSHVTRVVLPGWCQGDIGELERHFGKPCELGPKDLFDLPEYFGIGKRRVADLSRYWVEIIAEINHATRMPLPEILTQARAFAAAGANVIDIGGVPGETSQRIREIVSALRAENLRVSIDSFERSEVEQAVEAGAELILSCNQANYDWVTQLGVEVVAIPDTPRDPASLDTLIERLTADSVPFRADPIIEPIGMGFTDSLARYIDCRRKHPDIALMMGIGNVTELTEADSAGVNMLLAAFCEELGIQSVLTTQVINWCRTAVAEFDRARRLVHHAVSHRTVPKHLDGSLLMLRDARLRGLSPEQLADIAANITDPNFRIHVSGGELHLMNRDGHWAGPDAFRLFEQALHTAHQRSTPSAISPEHAFYLGYEMARAELALHLGKNYVQDEPLKFGVLGELKASSSAAVHE